MAKTERKWGIFFSALLLTGVMARVQALENNVRVSGTLVNEPCTLDPKSAAIPLDFGNLVRKYFYNTARTPGQEFHIVLQGCDLTVGKGVTLTFRGTESQALPGLLAQNGDSQGLAFGIEMDNGSGMATLPLNKPSPVVALSQGSLDLTLRGYVQAEPQAIQDRSIRPGPFMATALFELNYP